MEQLDNQITELTLQALDFIEKQIKSKEPNLNKLKVLGKTIYEFTQQARAKNQFNDPQVLKRKKEVAGVVTKKLSELIKIDKVEELYTENFIGILQVIYKRLLEAY